MSGVRASGVPMWKRAIQQPEKVADVLNMVATQGIKRTWSLIKEKRDAAYPTGYSAAGTIVAVGDEVSDLSVGDRVACAGAQYAHHAEYIRVPRNLCVLIPEELDWESASTVTLGAIALQGVRRAQPTMGETFVVIGLGVLGQLTVQLLRANGCQVIGVDLNRARIALAQTLGMNHGHHPDDTDLDQIARLTDGYGADGVIITAATPSDEVVSTAFKICRKKGRVVLVGDVGLQLDRSDFYAKEIDFLISTSYGPGRYDQRYEEQGLDYPISYIRWTENRNMAEYLRQLAQGRVRVTPLITTRYPIHEAGEAYATLSKSADPILVLLTYSDQPVELVRTLKQRTKAPETQGRIRIAVIGVGAFARSTHLPNLHELSDQFSLRTVVCRTGHTATAVAKQFGGEVG